MSKDRPVVVEVVEDRTTYASLDLPPEFVVLDRGEGAVEVGERYALVKYTEDVIHPQTKENLGRLELVILTGKIVNVQERMSLLKPDGLARERNAFSSLGRNWRQELIGLEAKRTG